MATYTPNLNLGLPTVGGDPDVWGAILNTNSLIIDAASVGWGGGGGPSLGAPTGLVSGFAGGTIPVGWLLCYGQAVSRTVFADLFAAVGVTYGAGNGGTTFNLPDGRGRTFAGLDNMGGTAAGRLTTLTTLGAVAGQQNQTPAGTVTVTGSTGNHTPTIATMASHNHTWYTPTVASGGSSSFAQMGEPRAEADGHLILFKGGSNPHNHALNATGAFTGDPMSVVQPTIGFNLIIKT